MKYTIEDTFDVSAAHYWSVFFSDEFNRELWPALDITCEPLSLERTGEGDALEIRREQRLTPRREVPAIIQKFVKGGFSYVEKNHFKARENLMRTVTVPSFMAEKIQTHGTYRLEPLGESRVKRVWEGTLECSIALIGGKIEKLLVDEVRESYRKATDFTRAWHAKHPAG
ncbi:MAG: DUF2505 domain-containing protein [Deltaproteobacteria bacterium]|nr:DUF2505 domain-containing protein [Deltaproteobacteria bacterium]MBK8715459.1 DUF2505 domain-containing protein [Deltaproteobacteria bacterium]MBP7292362.1 DUF2505 domain-containing protein [Nannocystaceae bacterium]